MGEGMSDARPDELMRVHAEHVLRCRTRIPLFFSVVLGAVVALLCLMHSSGRALAMSRLPESKARWAELQPPPVPDRENAAVLWRKAFEARVPWPGPGDTPPAGSGWRTRSSYAAGSPARTHLTANLVALSIVDQAAQIASCDWGTDCSDPSVLLDGNPRRGYLSKMREMARLASLRASIGGHDGNWTEVERSEVAMCAAARHVMAEPGLLSYMIADSMESMAVNSLEGALAVSEGSPSLADTRRLRAWVSAKTQNEPSLDTVVDVEERYALVTTDLRATGDPRFAHSFKTELAMLSYGSNPDWRYFRYDYLALVYPLERRNAVKQVRVFGEAARRISAGGNAEFVSNWQAPVCLFSELPLPSNLGGLVFHHSLEIPIKARAQWRVALVALAVLEFWWTHDQRWPGSLDQLGLEPSQLRDPCSLDGCDLRYAPDPDQNGGVMIWSVGRNFTDDSGKPASDDLTFRLQQHVAAKPLEHKQ